MESCNNQLNDAQIYAKWRVCNSWIFVNKCDSKSVFCTFCFQHWCEVHSIANYQSVNFMKFPYFSLIFWSFFKFPDFSGQFSNSLTIRGFPGSVTTVIHGSTVMKYWTYWAVTLKHNWSRKFHAIGNHILLFCTFLATFLITIKKKFP